MPNNMEDSDIDISRGMPYSLRARIKEERSNNEGVPP